MAVDRIRAREAAQRFDRAIRADLATRARTDADDPARKAAAREVAAARQWYDAVLEGGAET